MIKKPLIRLRNLQKQFGLLYLAKRIFARSLAFLFRYSVFYVLAKEDHSPEQIGSGVIIVDGRNIEEFMGCGIELDAQLRRQLDSFIFNNAYAVIVQSNNEVAAWGFVQESGISKYGGYDYSIPKNCYLLKNLYVLPGHRGQSIGKIINRARIESIPAGYTPIVFVIPDNKIAIRNLEMYGFTKVLLVKDYLILNSVHKCLIRMLTGSDIARTIREGFQE